MTNAVDTGSSVTGEGPVSDQFTTIEGRIANKGTHRFNRPGQGDWVLELSTAMSFKNK